MAFPQTPYGMVFELDLAGTWTDISTYVYQRTDVTLDRGASAEGSTVEPSRLAFMLDNRDGRFSPRNVAGAYYGTIGRNTAVRVSVPGTAVRALTYSPTYEPAEGITAPDSAALDIIADIDVRIDMTLPSWNSSLFIQSFIGKGTSPQFSWQFGGSITGGGKLRWNWSTTGSDSPSATSTVGLPSPHYGRKAIRVTHDVNNGAGGNTVTFYYSDTIAGSWTQLGDPVITAGVTSIFAGTGAGASVRISPDYAEVHAAKVMQGIAGTERANPDFTAQTSGATSFADAAGNTWSVPVPSELTNRQYLFHGEVSEWPVQWDPSGQDVYSPVQAAGQFRRLSQGDTPLRSTMAQMLASDTTAVAWWPAEDGTTATAIASGLAAGKPMQVSGTPSFAAFSDFTGSGALPTVALSQWRGPVTTYLSTGTIAVRFLLAIDAGGIAASSRLIRCITAGSARNWDVVYGSAGNGAISLRASDADGTEIVNSGDITPSWGLRGSLNYVEFSMTADVFDTDWAITIYQAGNSAGSSITGTESPATTGRALEVWVDPLSSVDQAAIGHVSVHNTAGGIDDSGVYLALTGYAGETAAGRLNRLFNNEDIPLTIVGAEGSYGDLINASQGTTPLMGPQGVAPFLDLARECEAADGGILYEARQFLGFRYLTSNARYSRAAALTLDYDGKDLSGMTVTDDDQQTRNDITVSRVDGSSARAELTTGALSTAAPPAGVGRYDTAVTLNVQDDGQLPSQAQWRLALGTVDEPRFPEITVELQRDVWTDAERTTVRGIELGERLAVADLPLWLPPDDLSQSIIGVRETLNAFVHELTFIGIPGRIYDGVETWTGAGRYDSYGSTLNASITTTATSLSVATPIGPLWTTDGAEVPFDILVGGERITVTAISGASSPQTFTATRSVNGVVHAWDAATAISLYSPMIWSL